MHTMDGSFCGVRTFTGDGTLDMKSNTIGSTLVVGSALGGAADGGRAWEGFGGDAMGGLPTAIQLLEHVAFGGMLRWSENMITHCPFH